MKTKKLFLAWILLCLLPLSTMGNVASDAIMSMEVRGTFPGMSWDYGVTMINNASEKEDNPTQVITSTIYVKAEAAPYLYSWYYDIDGQLVQPLGYWPGTLMTETEVVQGETFWKMGISRPKEVT